MPPADRQAYTAAVLCLMEKPPQVLNTTAPGARSRYDDFVAIHIVSTPAVHSTVRYCDQLPL
jgi:tyrosinase